MRHNFFLPAAILSIALSPALNAALSVQSAIGAEPVGSCKVNFDNLALGAQAGTLASGPSGSVTVTTTGNAGVVEGSGGTNYAPPFLTNLNGTGFADGGFDQNLGADDTPYLQAGNLAGGGSVTLTFATPQTYMGLLWGSVDGNATIFNKLEFFNGALSVGVVTGADVNAVIPNGNQSADGTARVFITSDLPFDSVVATSYGTNGKTFEFDNVAYNCAPPPCTGCVYTQGWYKNHAADWPTLPGGVLTLGAVGNTYTKTELLEIYSEPVKGNGLVSLAHQLITAKLNSLRGACVPAAVQQAIVAADLLIVNLRVPPVGEGSIKPNLTSPLIDILTAYNEGKSAGGPSHCD